MTSQDKLPHSKDSLIQAIDNGFKPKYLFFWGHHPNNIKNCLSQWYQASFCKDNFTYLTAEHFMMAEKARLFHDKDIENKIINATHPGEAKALGRMVSKFDQAKWDELRFDIVVRGNLLKFEQNPQLMTFLLNTEQRILVEASPVDKIWGIGLAENHEHAAQPEHWLGLNLLGFALMKVRTILKKA
ncbi:MAG: NADAR family protein [Gammaproteobacteria bacterium]|jgi:ribA/ribD-fused uncharacterized protein|nr:NADAR family protein [Gammaproteobacteria bacterium]